MAMLKVGGRGKRNAKLEVEPHKGWGGTWNGTWGARGRGCQNECTVHTQQRRELGLIGSSLAPPSPNLPTFPTNSLVMLLPRSALPLPRSLIFPPLPLISLSISSPMPRSYAHTLARSLGPLPLLPPQRRVARHLIHQFERCQFHLLLQASLARYKEWSGQYFYLFIYLLWHLFSIPSPWCVVV